MPFVSNKIKLFYFAIVPLLVLLAYSIAVCQYYWLAAIPLLSAICWVAIRWFDKLLYAIFLLVPLSVPLSEYFKDFAFDVSLPAEPLLIGTMLLFIIKSIYQGANTSTLFRHPVSIGIYIYLGWMFITTLTSTHPMVSAKFLISHIWFIVVFYFLVAKILEAHLNNSYKMMWSYIFGLLVVIIFALVRQSQYGFYNHHASGFVMNPFYKDHTSYGAALSMYIPFLAISAFAIPSSIRQKRWTLLLLAIFILAVVFSYTRAAWLSLVGALFIGLIVVYRVKFRLLLAVATIFIITAFSFQHQLLGYFEQNSSNSSDNLGGHISSMTNITTDASNMERINRWVSAWKMFKERPIFGFGPGTYQFNYAAYQLTNRRTAISTNSGDLGTAHSEYLGPLCESGLIGFLSVCLLIGLVVYTAIKTYTRTSDKQIKNIILFTLIGLSTYYLHGFLNNFLDTDKISAPFWSFTAMIVMCDLKSRGKRTNINKE